MFISGLEKLIIDQMQCFRKIEVKALLMKCAENLLQRQRYTYRVLQTIHLKLILLSAWAERVIMGSAKTALKFKYEI